MASRAHDLRHTYGCKRASILAVFANALLLLAMGSLAWEAAHRLADPAPVERLTIMAVAGGLVLSMGRHWIDPVVSMLIAAVVVWSTWSLFRQSLHLLFDGVPEGVDLREARALLESLPGVAGVHDLHVWAMGATEVALTAHLEMPGGAGDDAFLRDAIERPQERFEITHVTLQVVRQPFCVPCSV